MVGGLTKPVIARVRKGTGGRVIIRISRKIHFLKNWCSNKVHLRQRKPGDWPMKALKYL